MMINLLFVVIGVLLLLAAFALYTQTTVFARPTGSYQTTIVGKEEKDTVIYTGVFIPMKIYTVKTSENRKINVEKNQYNRINIGETVTVATYSNGLHRLQV